MTFARIFNIYRAATLPSKSRQHALTRHVGRSFLRQVLVDGTPLSYDCLELITELVPLLQFLFPHRLLQS